jgi:hypothetical protein
MLYSTALRRSHACTRPRHRKHVYVWWPPRSGTGRRKLTEQVAARCFHAPLSCFMPLRNIFVFVFFSLVASTLHVQLAMHKKTGPSRLCSTTSIGERQTISCLFTPLLFHCPIPSPRAPTPMFQQRMPMQIYNFLITGVDGQGNMLILHPLRIHMSSDLSWAITPFRVPPACTT